MGDNPGTSTSSSESHMANLVKEQVEQYHQELMQTEADVGKLVERVKQYDSLILRSPDQVKSIAILRKEFGYTGSIYIPEDLPKKVKKAIRRKATKAGIPIDED